MKNLRCVLVLLALAIAMAGCGSAVAPTDAADPVSVNTLDGAEGVPVDGMFKFAFSRLMTPSTVTTSTFFMVKNEVSPSLNKATVDEDVCDPTQAIDATVECSSPIGCTLTPAERLEYSTGYSICLMGDMQYATGVPFEGFMATFTAEVEGPLDLNNLNDAVDVPVNSSFRYRFLKEVNASTVDTSTYFIVPTPAAESASINKADIDSTICDAANAVASEVTCTRWSCTIAPSAYLDYITGYTACLTSDVSYTSTSGSGFNGFMASFTTGEWILSSIKLIKLDDTELELTDRPIPRMVHVKLTLSVAVTDESERAAFESAVTLVDGDDNAAGGTFEWAADYLSVTFTPNHQLEYGTEYTINVDTSTFPPLSLSMALSAGDMSFTTMAEKDINGDGFADVIVGAHGYNAGDFKGRAYIFLGSTSGISDCDLGDSTCVPHATITGKTGGGEDDGDRFGDVVSIAGDVNADGYDDVIVGAIGFDGEKGQSYVFLGSAAGIGNCDLSDPACVPHATITGGNTGDLLGSPVSTAGDINADGYDDVIVGAIGFDGDGTDKGRAYVFLGGSTLSGDLNAADADTTITGENNSDGLGVSVSTAGDVNADGYDDIIVGAYGYPGDGNWYGRVYVFLGSASGIADCDLSDECTPPTTITGGEEWGGVGQRVGFAGDVNADGYNDIIVGAPWIDRVYIFLGSGAGISDCDLTSPSTCVPDATITGEATDFLGIFVSTAGDVNGDGYADVIIGADRYPNIGFIGRAYIFMGLAASISDCDLGDGCIADTTLTGESEDDWFGSFE